MLQAQSRVTFPIRSASVRLGSLRAMVFLLVTTLFLGGLPLSAGAQTSSESDSDSEAQIITFSLLLVVLGVLAWIGWTSDRDRMKHSQTDGISLTPLVLCKGNASSDANPEIGDLGLGLTVEF